MLWGRDSKGEKKFGLWDNYYQMRSLSVIQRKEKEKEGKRKDTLSFLDELLNCSTDTLHLLPVSNFLVPCMLSLHQIHKNWKRCVCTGKIVRLQPKEQEALASTAAKCAGSLSQMFTKLTVTALNTPSPVIQQCQMVGCVYFLCLHCVPLSLCTSPGWNSLMLDLCGSGVGFLGLSGLRGSWGWHGAAVASCKRICACLWPYTQGL